MSKTAMELALARIELMKDIRPDSIHWEMFKQNYLEMEKKQTINAYENGYDSHNDIIYSNGEKYYNKTFNK